MQYSLTQQVRLGPAIPHPLDQFHPADLPFALSSAPWAVQRQLDGFVAPSIQGLEVAFSDYAVKPLLELVSLGERGIGLEKVIQRHFF